MLLKVADEATTKLTLNGQEKDAATSGLARMNMILHDNPEALIVQGNTLTDPKFLDGQGLDGQGDHGALKAFDYVVANPPFSDKRWSAGLDPLSDPHGRFKPFVYQHVMDYWAETMQDDCYLISDDGWTAETSRILVKEKKGKEKDKGWTFDLVPKEFIVARYFAEEQAAIDGLASELEGVTARQVNRAGVVARLKEIKGDAEMKDEAAVLKEWLKLSGEVTGLKKRVKEAEAELDLRAYRQSPELSEAEIKTLVVDDKWMAALEAAIHGEMERVSQGLTQRVKELAERHETPMPEMVERVAELEAKVNRHLERMGFTV